MAFDLGRAAIVQPAGWNELMGGFVGPPQIKGPFTESLERQRTREYEGFAAGMGEVGANARTKATNDVTLQIANDNRAATQKSNRLAGVTQLLAAGDFFGGGTGGRRAGQVFGVGNGSSATESVNQKLLEQAQTQELLLRQRNNLLQWSRGSEAMTGEATKFAPQLPRL